MNPDLLYVEHGVVDLAGYAVHTAAGSAELTDGEVRLLVFLAGHRGDVVDRDVLQEQVWGFDRLRATRALDTAVRRLRVKVEPDPAHPRHLITLRSRGWRWVPAAGPPRDLPAADHALVGRRDLLQRAAGALTPGAVVVLTGTGGVGKTRTALHLATALADRFDGVVWCSLAEAATGADVVDAVAAALRIAPTDADPAGTIGRVLGHHGQALVVLDNAEQVADAVTVHVERWHVAAPNVTWLVTSRHELAVSGAAALDVPPLDSAHALSLFVDRARLDRPRFEPDAHTGPLVDHLGGLPLAIELAAARMGVLTPRQLADRFTTHLNTLRTGRRDVPDRHRSLLAALGASWDLLDGSERQALVDCTVFAGSFDRPAAAAVLLDDGAALDRLVAHHLAQRQGDRYGLLPPVRAWAATLGDSGAARVRFERWVASLARDPFVPLADRANALAALDGAVARRDGPVAAGAAVVAHTILVRTGPLELAADVVVRALALDGVPDQDRVWLRALQGGLDGMRGRPREAASVLRECLVEARDPHVVADLQSRLGHALVYVGEADEGFALLEAAVGAEVGTGQRIRAQWRLANGLFIRGHHLRCLDLCRAALDGADEGDPRLTWARMHVPASLTRAGRYDEGAAAFDALEIDIERDPQAAEFVLVEHAMLLLQRGDAARAEQRLVQALDLSRRHGAAIRQATMLLGNLALVRAARGQWVEAGALLEEQLAAYELERNVVRIAQVRANRGMVRLAQGEASAAAEDFEASTAGPRPAVTAAALLALALARTGRVGAAVAAERRASEGAHEAQVEATLALARAEIARAQGDREVARGHVRDAERIAAELGWLDQAYLRVVLRQTRASIEGWGQR